MLDTPGTEVKGIDADIDSGRGNRVREAITQGPGTGNCKGLGWPHNFYCAQERTSIQLKLLFL